MNELRTIHHHTETFGDGTTMTLTVQCRAESLSAEDIAFIRRFVPLAAGVALEKLEDK